MQAGEDEAARLNSRPVFVLLRSGEKISGTLQEAPFHFSTAFGKFQLEFHKISSMDIYEGTESRDRVVLMNSDALSGKLEDFILELTLTEGSIRKLSRNEIESINFVSSLEQEKEEKTTRSAEEFSVGTSKEFDGMKFVYIPAGDFYMGSSRREIGHHGDEAPVRKVEISKGFWLTQFEITQEQWISVVEGNPSRFMNCPACPVEQVSWEDVWQFVDILNERNGCSKALKSQSSQSIQNVMDQVKLDGIPSGCYRLPTEAEWEYAARAGTSTAYSFDTRSTSNDYAWQVTNARGRTHPVGQKKPNPWGLYDVYGNVWEWVYDRYADSYSGAEGIDPKGPLHGQHRVGRGGGFNLTGGFCRSASRHWSAPDVRYCYIGFRLLRTL